MLNKVILIGRLTKDPETKAYGEDTIMTGFTLAVDRQFKSEKGPAADFIEENLTRKKSQIKAIVSDSLEKAKCKGEEVEAIIPAWGDGDCHSAP